MSDTVAFDADVIIYAAATDHPLGARVRPLIERTDVAAIGSVLLLPEVLAKPMRADDASARIGFVPPTPHTWPPQSPRARSSS